MVVSAQSVDDMSKQKATGGYGISRADVRLRVSGRERYVAAAVQASLLYVRVECSCSARVASHPRSMDELLPGCVAGAKDS